MRAATTPEHNKRLARRALEEIYANGDLEVADELIHPDFQDHEPAHPVRHTYIWRIADDKIVEHWGKPG